MRFREYVIQPDDMLYIMGTATDNPYVEEFSSQKNEADIMIKKGENKICYITKKPEKKMLEEMNSLCQVYIYGGALLSIICLIVILAYLHML